MLNKKEDIIGIRASLELKRHIKQEADKLHMTVSKFIMERGLCCLGIKPFNLCNKECRKHRKQCKS